jgi:hypothetical protein
MDEPVARPVKPRVRNESRGSDQQENALEKIGDASGILNT